MAAHSQTGTGHLRPFDHFPDALGDAHPGTAKGAGKVSQMAKVANDLFADSFVEFQSPLPAAQGCVLIR
jgi:hypothetical protein